MAICPFATWKPISGSSGSYTAGPFKIVHHTTEGSSAQGAFNAFRAHRSDPHFTVDGTAIYQHIDTGAAARALRNPPGGVQTNRDSAIQIEVVGFAHRPKTRATLENVRQLCRWIETTHNVPRVWPNGRPKPARNGNDPGGHNRSAANWDGKAGHYGHCHVPENVHWDPAYTEDEVGFLMLGDTESLDAGSQFESIILEDPGLETDRSRMPDHSDPHDTEETPGRVPRRRARKKAKPKKAKTKKAARAGKKKSSTTRAARGKSAKRAAAKRKAKRR